MRKIAYTDKNLEYRKLMIYSFDDGKENYLFLYENINQLSCSADYWFETLEDAENCAKEIFETEIINWIFIDDPLPYCQHDTIEPVRVVGREQGNPQWDKLERFIGGKWEPFSID